MKKPKLPILLTASLALFASSASAVTVLDQASDGPQSDFYIIGSLYRAQTFTVGISGTLTRFEVFIESLSGSALFEIWDASSGLPALASSGVALASATVSYSGSGFFGTDVSLDVDAGDVLALVQIGGNSTGIGEWAGSSANPYAGGAAFTTFTSDPDGAFFPEHPTDFSFKTYVATSVPDAGSTLSLLSASALALVFLRRFQKNPKLSLAKR